MKKQKHVVVIGGGASGIVAAISAKRNGADVTLLERNSRVGKKILATGNGRCNLTNINSVSIMVKIQNLYTVHLANSVSKRPCLFLKN